MGKSDGTTPVIIGVGQFSERPQDDGYAALSHMDLAGKALKAAIGDSAATGDLAAAIDTIAAIRQFENSTPHAVAPFGNSNNPPRSIAKRVGTKPERAILEITGGQGPQKLVGEFAADIASGKSEVAAIVGAEAISTVLTLSKAGEKPDWSEEVGGSLEDRGFGLEGMFDRALVKHGGGAPIQSYAFFDNARRAKLGLSLEDYRKKIGELFEPFTQVAAANPHAAAPTHRSAEELATVTERNRIVAEPYPRMTVARDQVNQAAAIIIASTDKARELGVPEEKWVHIHAVTNIKEQSVLARPDLARSPASIASLERALQIAEAGIEDVGFIDLYSCFAIPVFNVLDHFGLAVDDPRGFTLTGGLPFFGGAGNNYSSHGIAEAVVKARTNPGSLALASANGGVMSKYATGIYSTAAADWSSGSRFEQMENGEEPMPTAVDFAGEALLETYTVVPGKKGTIAIVIGKNDAGERVVANADLDDPATKKLFDEGMPFGAKLNIESAGDERFVARAA